jgi:ABC-type phosphonate transport system, ATPase component
MKDGHVVESGLADQILDDPQHPYTQLLVSSVLQA